MRKNIATKVFFVAINLRILNDEFYSGLFTIPCTAFFARLVTPLSYSEELSVINYISLVLPIGVRATKFLGGHTLVCPTRGLDECRRGSPGAFSPAKILKCRVSQMPFPAF